MRQAVRDALIRFMAVTAPAAGRGDERARRAGRDHAKAIGEGRYKGWKPSYTRHQYETARDMLSQEAGISAVARETGLTRQTIYRIKEGHVAAEAALGDVSLRAPPKPMDWGSPSSRLLRARHVRRAPSCTPQSIMAYAALWLQRSTRKRRDRAGRQTRRRPKPSPPSRRGRRPHPRGKKPSKPSSSSSTRAFLPSKLSCRVKNFSFAGCSVARPLV
jgi:hypothetical protein